jgi:hypothetical protein
VKRLADVARGPQPLTVLLHGVPTRLFRKTHKHLAHLVVADALDWVASVGTVTTKCGETIRYGKQSELWRSQRSVSRACGPCFEAGEQLLMNLEKDWLSED